MRTQKARGRSRFDAAFDAVLAGAFALSVSVSLVASLSGCEGKKDDGTAAKPAASAPAPAASTATAADSIPAFDLNNPDNGAGAMPTPAAPPPPAPPDVAAPPADAKKTASGLATKVLTKGTAKDHPTKDDKVKVNYTGWTTDGKVFDSTVTRNAPATFGVGEVIPGWTEGLQLMVEGEKRRMWIPANLAYGPRGMPGIPPNSALTFDVELLEIQQAPKAPPDVAAAPADAKKTASGLAYKLLSAGKDPNAPSPGPTSMVMVNYSGWTTDGKMFDSTRGQPTAFPLNRVIAGWTEGLQLMKIGDKMRFWIPGKLAYEDPSRPKRPGTPQGTLVFDVELLNVAAQPANLPQSGAPQMMHPH